MAAIAVIGLIVVRPRVQPSDPVLLGLAAMGLANLVGAALAGWSGAWPPALAAASLTPMYLIARGLDARRRELLLLAIVLVAATAAVAGILGWLARRSPQAANIDHLWRAAGPFEYPPALALVIVCGLAATFALVALRLLPRAAGIGAATVLGVGLLLTFDRFGIVAGALVVIAFLRMPAVRVLWPAAAVLVLVTLLALAVHPPTGGSLTAHLRHGPLNGRSAVWSDAWSAFVKRPWDGYGPGGFARISLGRVDSAAVGRAHTALEQAVDAGLVALAGVCVVLIAGGWRCACGVLAADPSRRAYGCVGVAVVVSGLFDFTWSFAPLALCAVVAMALCAREPVSREIGADEKLTTAARRHPSRSP